MIAENISNFVKKQTSFKKISKFKEYLTSFKNLKYISNFSENISEVYKVHYVESKFI